MTKSNKSYAGAVILSGIFGIFGIHHFYLGRYAHGLFDLSLSVFGFAFIMVTDLVPDAHWGYPLAGFILLGIDWLHSIIITIYLLIGEYKAGKGHYVMYPGQKLKTK